MFETAYAKLNLELRVLGRRPDGFHELDTLFAFAEDGDVLRVEEGKGLSLQVIGEFADRLGNAEDNLVFRAARLLGGGDAALILEKRLPVSAGLGGGSADAAAALRLLNRWWNLGLGKAELLALARHLGSDVPACLLSRAARGTGRGDLLQPTQTSFPDAPLLLVNPGIAVSTAEVFARWRGLPSAGNDLEPPALEVAPVIADVLATLRSGRGVRLAGMSGSGATCFAIFETEEHREAAKVALPSYWWRLASRVR